jgi:TolB-like protein/class 3 adenylate cyclase/Flp pilus assembly protein TadD
VLRFGVLKATEVARAMERKLAAILAADVAGYSRLMGADEVGTLDRLRSSREVIDALIAAHRGRIFNSAGDSVVAEFGSAVEAIHCAVEIQQDMARRNEPLSKDKRLEYRIGLNIGDVMVEGGNLFGDGVNVAARVQELAKPGGIGVSRNVYNQVKNKVSHGFEALGEYRVKNISEPVVIYRVLPEAATARPRIILWLAQLGRRRLAVATLGAVVILGAIGTVAWQGLRPGQSRDGKPAIAVLPLDNIGGDPATTRLADGITEDIITDLAHFRDLDVIARNSTAVYKDKAVDVRQVGKELGVGYVLEGSIQRSANKIRVTAQLVDTGTGAHLWSERWDRPVEDTFEVQTEIAEQVAGALGSVNGSASISADIIRKLKGRPPASLTAYDYYLLAVEGKGAFTKESMFAAVDNATKAIELDPNFARAYAVRARAHYNTSHYGVDYETAMQRMEADARRAVELDPNEPEARAALAWYLAIRGRLTESEHEIRVGLESNPANVSALIFASSILATNGKPEEGAALADKVLRIDPRANPGSLNTIKDAYYFARRFQDTIDLVSRLPDNARARGSRVLLTFSYALLGQKNEADEARAQLLEKYPTVSAELMLNEGWGFMAPAAESLFLDGFRAAGVPVCAKEEDLAKIVKPIRLPECIEKTPATDN